MKEDNLKPNEFTYTILIPALSRQPSKCLEIYEEMLKEVAHPSVVCFDSMLRVLSLNGDLESSLKVREDMKKAEIDVTHFTVMNMTRVFINHRQFDALVDLIKEAEENGVKLEAGNYVSAIIAFGESGDLDSSWETYLIMKQAGHKSDSLEVANGAMMVHYAARGNVAKCTELLEMMNAEGMVVSRQIHGHISKARKLSSSGTVPEVSEEVKQGGAKILQALRDHELFKKKIWKVDEAWLTALEHSNKES